MGINLHNCVRPEKAQPLVLLHGMHLSTTMWFSNITDLCRNYRIYACNTIGGVGRSVVIHPPKSRIDLAGWLNAVLDGLRISQAHILRHSHGGRLALNFALSAPERIQRFILLAPLGLQHLVGQFWLKGIPAILFQRRPFNTGFMKWMTVEGFVVNDVFVEQFVLGVKAFNLRNKVRALPTVFINVELLQIKARTLLLIGREEVIYNPEAAVKRLAQLI
jgi:pimeloyl-ACP methyl ester carboxylesterase